MMMEVLGSMPWFGIMVPGRFLLVEDLATVPGSSGFLDNSWVIVDSGWLPMVILVTSPNSVGIFPKFTTFLSTLRWPQRENEMGKFGVFFWGMLVLFERWAGHRLLEDVALA